MKHDHEYMKKLLLICFFLSIIKSDLIWETRLNQPCTGLNSSSACGVELLCLDSAKNLSLTNSFGKCQYCDGAKSCIGGVCTSYCYYKSSVLDCKKLVNKENQIVMGCAHKDLLPYINLFDILAVIVK
jgi:hypothetical protein